MNKPNPALEELLNNYLKPAGVTNKRVSHAFLSVPREKFVLPEFLDSAYENTALPIEEDQTISQPSLVGQMTQLLSLTGDEKVLEIGTGSGYQAAILSKLAKKIYSVEIIEVLAGKAANTLKKLGIGNVEVILGDGSLGLKKYAPYDAIIVTAAAKKIPQPLVDQLAEGGRIVIPVKENFNNQKLLFGVKNGGVLKVEGIESARFVPLVGKYS